MLEIFEPGDEPVGIGRRLVRPVADIAAHALDEGPFQPEHADLAIQIPAPVMFRELRG